MKSSYVKCKSFLLQAPGPPRSPFPRWARPLPPGPPGRGRPRYRGPTWKSSSRGSRPTLPSRPLLTSSKVSVESVENVRMSNNACCLVCREPRPACQNVRAGAAALLPRGSSPPPLWRLRPSPARPASLQPGRPTPERRGGEAGPLQGVSARPGGPQESQRRLRTPEVRGLHCGQSGGGRLQHCPHISRDSSSEVRTGGGQAGQSAHSLLSDNEWSRGTSGDPGAAPSVRRTWRPTVSALRSPVTSGSPVVTRPRPRPSVPVFSSCPPARSPGPPSSPTSR